MARVCVLTSFVSVVGLSEPAVDNRRELGQQQTRHRLTGDVVDVLIQSADFRGGNYI